MIGAFTNRMAAVLWVILVLSILAVANRIYYTYLALNELPMPSRDGAAGVFNRAFFWTDERATLPYDLWVHRDPRVHLAARHRTGSGIPYGARAHSLVGLLRQLAIVEQEYLRFKSKVPAAQAAATPPLSTTSASSDSSASFLSLLPYRLRCLHVRLGPAASASARAS